MSLRLVTLDCANTLLRGAWDPVRFALEAAQAAGLCLPQRAAEAYGALLRLHYPAILAANRKNDRALVCSEYVRLGQAWLARLDVDPALATEVVDEAIRILPDLYELFPDTVPFLVEARKRGLRLAIVSNWDVSLPRVLAAHGLDRLVDEVYASLVVGAEKPDPAMIHLAMSSAGVSPQETLHVGDDPVDDLGAAENAGVRGALLERPDVGARTHTAAASADSNATTIASLLEVLDWID